MKRYRELLLSLLLIIIFPIYADDIQRADSAYKAGNYEEAIDLYSQIMDTQGISAGILYNQGNAFYKLGKDGEAIVCYERAKKLDPKNKSINQNLNFVSAKILEQNKGSLNGKAGNLEPDAETFFQSLYRLITIETKSNNWAVFAVMAFLLFLGGMALYMFTPNVLARKTGFFSGICFLGFTMIFVIFAYLGAHRYKSQQEAILMAFTTELLDQPSQDSQKVTSTLHRGTKLKILEETTDNKGEEWTKVKLNSSNVGWIKKENIEII